MMIAIKNLLSVLGICTLLACGDRQLVEVKNDAGLLTESFQIDKKTKLKDGQYLRYNEGVLVEEATYHLDTLTGRRILFFDGGGKEIEEHYVAGLHHGPFKTYYEGGDLKLAGHYSKGVMDSIWVKYYPSGQIMEKVEMRNNNENGPFVEYHENGNLKARGTYLDGDNEHGELLLYDEQGQLERKMECDKGICHTVWSRE